MCSVNITADTYFGIFLMMSRTFDYQFVHDTGVIRINTVHYTIFITNIKYYNIMTFNVQKVGDDPFYRKITR